jgi:hypothetical protein
MLPDEGHFNALNLEHPWMSDRHNGRQTNHSSQATVNHLNRRFDALSVDPHNGSHSAPIPEQSGPSMNGHRALSRNTPCTSESPIPSTSSSSSTPNPGNTPRRQGSAPPELSDQVSTATIRPSRGRELAHRVTSGSAAPAANSSYSSAYDTSGSNQLGSSATSVEIFPPYAARPPYIERDDVDEEEDRPPLPRQTDPVPTASNNLSLPIVENNGRQRRSSGLRNPFSSAAALLTRSRSRSPAPSR